MLPESTALLTGREEGMGLWVSASEAQGKESGRWGGAETGGLGTETPVDARGRTDICRGGGE